MPQTTTERGRAKLVTPDLGYDAEIDGGVALSGVVNTIWTSIADSLGVKWTGSVTVANGNFIDVVHNFGQDSSNITLRFTKADGSRYTRAQAAAAFTITHTNANTVRVTNSSGGSLTFFLVVLPYTLGITGADFDEGSFGGESDDLILNKDAAGSGADWLATIRRPSSGMTANAVVTLPSVTSILATLNTAETYLAKKVHDKTAFTAITDAASTGANVNLGAGSAVPDASVLSLTNAGCDGVAGIFPPSPGDYRLLFLFNNTGGELAIRNMSGSGTAGGQILTGSGADLAVVAGGCVPLFYSPGLSSWVVFGGGGGSSGGSTQTITQGFPHGFAVGDWVSVDGAGYLPSAANNENNSRSVGRVSQIVDANSFVLQTSGFFTSAGLFTVGRAHHVSTTAGAFQLNPPTGASQWTKQIFTAITDSLAFINFGPAHVSGATVGASGTQTLSNKVVQAQDGFTGGGPSWSFVSETDMGFYRASAGVTAWDVNGVLRLSMSTSTFTWSGGRLDVSVASGTSQAQIRTRTAAGDETIHGTAAQGNQIIAGSTIGDTCHAGKAGQSFLWSADAGATIHFSLSSTRAHARVALRWANLTASPATRLNGDVWYRFDTDRFTGAAGVNTSDIGNFVVEGMRGLQSFGAGGDFTAIFSALPYEVFLVRSTLSIGSVTVAALFFTTTAPQDGKVVELIGTSDTDTIAVEDSRASAKGLVMNGPWTSGYGRVIRFRYSSTLDRWIEITRNG